MSSISSGMVHHGASVPLSMKDNKASSNHMNDSITCMSLCHRRIETLFFEWWQPLWDHLKVSQVRHDQWRGITSLWTLCFSMNRGSHRQCNSHEPCSSLGQIMENTSRYHIQRNANIIESTWPMWLLVMQRHLYTCS